MNGSVQETEEDQHQSYSSYCVNSFNVHHNTYENCYNYIPVTRSSFLLYFGHNLNSVIRNFDGLSSHRQPIILRSSRLAVSGILAIYLYGKKCQLLDDFRDYSAKHYSINLVRT
jgi:hypothetical protein